MSYGRWSTKDELISKLDGITYLFCGDITVETEKLLIEKYQMRLKL